MGILIDTSVLIDWEKGRLDVAVLLSQRQSEPIYISVITASELLHGVHRAKDPRIAERRLAFIEKALDRFPALDITSSIARLHARLWADLQIAGTPVGPHDLWIAASCLVHQLTLATANDREFKRIPSLPVENWRSPAT